MGLIVERTPGPDFRQSAKPTDVTQGNVWFNPESLRNSMADGTDYWGRTENGVAGYSPFDTILKKMTFATEAISTSSASKIGGYHYNGGNWGSPTTGFGYIATGYVNGYANPPYGTTIQKLSFSTENWATISTLMPVGCGTPASLKSPSAGYTAGGSQAYGLGITNIQRMDFGTENVTNATSGLTSARYYGAGTYGQFNGYISGGTINYTVTESSAVDRLSFSTEAVASLGTTLRSINTVMKATNSDVAGYNSGGVTWVGGYSYRNRIDKLMFSSESMVYLATTIGTACEGSDVWLSGKDGFLVGGYFYNGSWTYATNIERLHYATEALSTFMSGLANATNTSNSPVSNSIY
jgi:hypothetical protein